MCLWIFVKTFHSNHLSTCQIFQELHPPQALQLNGSLILLPEKQPAIFKSLFCTLPCSKVSSKECSKESLPPLCFSLKLVYGSSKFIVLRMLVIMKDSVVDKNIPKDIIFAFFHQCQLARLKYCVWLILCWNNSFFVLCPIWCM